MTSLPPGVDRLADLQPITVILRLVVTSSGELIHGEIADVAGRVQRRVRGWERLAGAVQECVARWQARC